jgi:hypothetical protein
MRTAPRTALAMQARPAAGYSITMKPESLDRFAYPSGEVWAPEAAAAM